MAIKAASSSEGTRFALEDGESAPEIVAEINITPLTDVFLVLLIIFMVTTSVITQMGVDVTLPKSTQAASAASSDPEGVIVTLLSDGGIELNEKRIENGDVAELESQLKTWFLAHPSARLVVLEGDHQAFLGAAVSIMDAAKRAGAEKFSIATQGK
jgi:biopolymer transport protein ExbD